MNISVLDYLIAREEEAQKNFERVVECGFATDEELLEAKKQYKMWSDAYFKEIAQSFQR